MISALADDARSRRIAREAELTVDARIRLALHLGKRRLDVDAGLHPELSRAEAREALAATRRVGRRPSRIKAA